MSRKVPEAWSDDDRKLYLNIALRRKREHVSAYALIAIGGQLFHRLETVIDNQTHGESEEEDDEEIPDSDDCESQNPADEN